MTESARIREQLRRSLEGEAWHGPAVYEVLKGVSAKAAAARPIAQAHSIWEIVLHVTVWVEQIRARLLGDAARELPPERDWPPQPKKPTAAAWAELQDRLRKAHAALDKDIAKLDDARMDEPILEGFSSVYVTLHGLVQHNLYHAGQVAVLKKGE